MQYFFTKYIKKNKVLNTLAILLINFLMLTLRFLRPKKGKTDRNKCVVVISLNKLGDTVFTINAIKKIINYHKEKIYIVCYEETIPIYKLKLNSVDYITISAQEFRYRLAVKSARKKIESLNPYIIYDLTGKISSVSLFFRSSAKEIVGCNDPYYKAIYTKFVPIRREPHITDIYLDAINPIISDRSLDLSNFKMDLNGEYVAILPFASLKFREWGLNRFIKLAELLKQKFPCKIIAPPGIIPFDISEVIKNIKIDLVETKTTYELIEVIKESFLLVGNDSGPVHIANLLGKPTLTIYGPSNPEFHKPLVGDNDYIFKEMKCSPKNGNKFCFTHGGIFCPSNECMHSIEVEEVEEKVLTMLNRLSIQSKH